MKDIINRILKILSTVIFIILVLIIIVIIAYIVRINVLAKEDRLGEIKLNIYTILTQSMYPTIKAGDVVVTYRELDDKYNMGDIITFISDTNGGITITHRIKEIYSVNDSFSYRTQGDNNNTPDNEIVPGSNIFGRVVLKIPKIGYIQQFLSSMIGWIVVIVLPSLGIIIYDILKVIKSIFGVNNRKVEESQHVIEARKALREKFESIEEESKKDDSIPKENNLNEDFNKTQDGTNISNEESDSHEEMAHDDKEPTLVNNLEEEFAEIEESKSDVLETIDENKESEEGVSDDERKE